MDDFLYNLRRETDKRNRRQGQGGQQQYRGPDRRAGKDQRRDFPRRPEGQGEPAGMLPEIKALLDAVTDNQRLLLENDYRKTEALEVIAAALRVLAGGELPIEPVKRPSTPAKPVAAPMIEAVVQAPVAEPVSDEEEPAAPPVEAAPAVSQESIPAEPIFAEEAKAVDPVPDTTQARGIPLRSEKADVRKLALSLRDKGMTFKEIAKYLDDEKVPTFSGKGGWHAPTIHKLCKEGAE